MPIYEYRCGSCDRISAFFIRSIGAALTPVCSHCQSDDMQRRMSSFALGKTAQAVHQQYPSANGVAPLDYYSDPRNIGRNVEESFQRHGVELPPSVRDSIAAAREGSLPKDIAI